MSDETPETSNQTAVNEPYSPEEIQLLQEETRRLVEENSKLIEKLRAEQREAQRAARPQNEAQMKIDVKKVPANQVNTGVKPAAEPPKTFYVNVLDFVMSYLSVIFGTETTQTAKRIWLNDWWRYPAVVSRINALWMAWEKSYKANQIETWFLHTAEPMMRMIMDKETGIFVHYVAADSSNLFIVRKGEKLPTVTPPNSWYQDVASQIQSMGRIEIEKYEKVKMQRAQQQQQQNGGAANG